MNSSSKDQALPQKPPERVWVFQLPDGHWEVRWEDPCMPHAREYKAVTT